MNACTVAANSQGMELGSQVEPPGKTGCTPIAAPAALPHGPEECAKAQLDIFNDLKEPAA